MSEFGDLIPEFVEESLEHLKNIEEDIIQIEAGTSDNELINRVFRAVHSVKGGSSFMGLMNIEHLSHRMEDIFNLVRNGDLVFTSAISSEVLKAIDKLKEMLEHVGESEDFPIDDNLAALERCLAGNKAPKGAAKVEVRLHDQPVPIDRYKYTTCRNQGKRVFHVRIELRDAGRKSPLEYFRELEKTGDILDSYIDMERVMTDPNFSGEGVPLSLIYATVLEKDLLIYHFDVGEQDVVEILEKDLGAAPAAGKPAAKAPVEAEPPDSGEQPEVVAPTAPAAEAPAAEDEGENEAIDVIEDHNEFLSFNIDEEEYGIPIKRVYEIITMLAVTPIPNSDPYTIGIINLRGDIIPVFDFRRRLQFPEKEYHAQTIILVLKIEEKKIGVVVDRVSEVIALERSQITDAPAMHQIPPEYLLGIGQKDGKFIILLKLSEMFVIGGAA